MVFKKIRKSHVDWRDFLCGTPASDYIFQKDAYEEQIENAVNFIKDADAVIIGPVQVLQRRQDSNMVERDLPIILPNL